MHQEGLEKFTNQHLCVKLVEASQENLRNAVSTPQTDPRHDVIFAGKNTYYPDVVRFFQLDTFILSTGLHQVFILLEFLNILLTCCLKIALAFIFANCIFLRSNFFVRLYKKMKFFY